MKINIAGDFFISKDINDSNLLVQDVIPYFERSDLNIANLETPITDEEVSKKIAKTGPHLNGNIKTIDAFKSLRINLVTLANNHILDYDEKGLSDTINLLRENKIDYLGADVDYEKIFKEHTLYDEKEDLSIAILNFAENEWSTARNNKCGATPIDIVDNYNKIKKLKSDYDKIIVILHAGHEHYNLPSPRMKKMFHFYVDAGADLIVCHHSHSVTGYELYNDVPIFYGIGNFIFCKKSNYEDWFHGLILTVDIQKNKKIDFKIKPVCQDKNYKLRFYNDDEQKIFENKISNLNRIIGNDVLLEDEWNKFVHKSTEQYLKYFSPVNLINSRYFRAFFFRSKLYKLFMNSVYLKILLNQIRCESHADLSISVIEKHLYNK